MFCQHHANATSPEPDSWGHALLHFVRHERRCWRRVAYWLTQFRSATPAMRCAAWHAVPAEAWPQQEASSPVLAGKRVSD